MPRKLPPLDFLISRFTYDPLTGAVRWRERPLSHFSADRVGRTWNSRYAGTEGTVAADGCRRFRVEFDGASIRIDAHVIAYALHHRTVEFGEIDHRDNDRGNTRIKNLRPATRTQNNANRRGWSKTGLPKGVTRFGSRFAAYASFGGRTKYLGRYDAPEDAHAAYVAFAAAQHGEFANFGRNVHFDG